MPEDLFGRSLSHDDIDDLKDEVAALRRMPRYRRANGH
jgi:hypothetical protein